MADQATEPNFPPKIDFVDGSNDGTPEKATETETPLSEGEKTAMNRLREAVDSADVEDINRLVKQFKDDPESLNKIAEHLNKELKRYGINASVEFSHNDKDILPEASLVLSQMYQTEGATHLDSVTFSTEAGVAAYERQSSESKDGSGGGGGGGGLLRPSNDRTNLTVSHVLRKMSHDRTH
ncbi:MAG: hypothetical protein K8F91_19265 [Candidatus Obscuribacterales bacterium]|nr:hypothetical protein [Candidatus Obscuribacterales bacterium]